MPTLLAFDLVEDLADRAALGQVAQFHGKVLLKRLVAYLGFALQLSMHVIRDVTDENVRHAYIMLSVLGAVNGRGTSDRQYCIRVP